MRLCESRCGDRQEQEGKRLPAHPLIELELGWGLAEVGARPNKRPSAAGRPRAAAKVRIRTEAKATAQETMRPPAWKAAQAKATPLRAEALAKALAKGAARLGRAALRRFWRQSKRRGRYAAMVYEATVTAEPVKKMSRKNYARMVRNRGRGILRRPHPAVKPAED